MFEPELPKYDLGDDLRAYDLKAGLGMIPESDISDLNVDSDMYLKAKFQA